MASISVTFLINDINDNNLLYQKYPKDALFSKEIYHLLVNDRLDRAILSGEIVTDNLEISTNHFVFRTNLKVKQNSRVNIIDNMYKL